MTPEQAIAIARARRAREQGQVAEQAAAPAAPEQAPEMTPGRLGGLGARGLVQGGVGFAGAIPAAITDAVNGTANLAYRGIDAAAGLAGYEPGLAEAHNRATGGPMANMKMVSEVGRRAADIIGTPTPVTGGEKLGVAAIEGVTGAAGGVGAGNLLARGGGRVATAIADIFRANPTSQIIAGGTSGAAAEGVSQVTDNPVAPFVAGAIGGAVVPSTLRGRETIATQAGLETAAQDVLRGRARDGSRAIDSLLTAEPFTPEFRFHGSDAARDPGIASLSNRMREYADDAGGMSTDLKANNNTVLSEALTRHGAGQGEATRAAQRRVDQANIQAMDLGSLPQVDVTNFITRLQQQADPRTTGNPEVAKAFQEMLTDVTGVARRQVGMGANNGDMWTIPPAHLQELRKVFSARRNNGALTNNSALRNARVESRSALFEIDDILNQETGGRYGDYLSSSRTGRTEADRQDFMENFAEVVNRRGREGYNDETGALNVNESAWLGNSTIESKPLEKGSRTTIANLDPERQGFIRGARADINRAGYASKARKGKNSASISNTDVDKMVTEATGRGQGPVAKVSTPLLWALGTSANAAARYTTPLAQPVGRAFQRGGENVLDNITTGAQSNVRRVLGEAETDPVYMAHILRRARAYNPGVVASTGLLAVRSGRNAMTQGFAAGARAEERREDERERRVKRYR